MKRLLKTITVSLFAFTSCQSSKENRAHKHIPETVTVAPADTIKKSIPKEEHALIGKTHFTIKYHAPAVRGRMIWGGLVTYDEVWVTGAHSATTLEFDQDIVISGKPILAGKYAFFTIPGKEKWVLILNKNWDQHLADDYDAKEDVVRIEVTPQILAESQERLKYSLTDEDNNKVAMNMRWEKIKVILPIQLN